jgi:hypothetical protein
MLPEWLWVVIIVSVVLALAGLVWRGHSSLDDERNNHIWDQIGRHSEAGMRKTLHNVANEITGQRGDLKDHERRLNRIESDKEYDERRDE